MRLGRDDILEERQLDTHLLPYPRVVRQRTAANFDILELSAHGHDSPDGDRGVSAGRCLVQEW